MKYYLLAILDDAAQEHLSVLSDQLIQEGFEYMRYTQYHITLWDSDEIDKQILAHLEKTCHATPVIKTALGSVGLFGLAVAFLAPLPCLPLLLLEQRICGQINDAPDGWVPTLLCEWVNEFILQEGNEEHRVPTLLCEWVNQNI